MGSKKETEKVMELVKTVSIEERVREFVFAHFHKGDLNKESDCLSIADIRKLLAAVFPMESITDEQLVFILETYGHSAQLIKRDFNPGFFAYVVELV
jgi:hypothetical protein